MEQLLSKMTTERFRPGVSVIAVNRDNLGDEVQELVDFAIRNPSKQVFICGASGSDSALILEFGERKSLNRPLNIVFASLEELMSRSARVSIKQEMAPRIFRSSSHLLQISNHSHQLNGELERIHHRMFEVQSTLDTKASKRQEKATNRPVYRAQKREKKQNDKRQKIHEKRPSYKGQKHRW